MSRRALHRPACRSLAAPHSPAALATAATAASSPRRQPDTSPHQQAQRSPALPPPPLRARRFLKIMDEISEGLRYTFQTDSKYTLMVSGTGHAGGGACSPARPPLPPSFSSPAASPHPTTVHPGHSSCPAPGRRITPRGAQQCTSQHPPPATRAGDARAPPSPPPPPHTIPLRFAGMEAAIANLIEPGEKIIVGNAGIWGARVADLSARYAGECPAPAGGEGAGASPRAPVPALPVRGGEGAGGGRVQAAGGGGAPPGLALPPLLDADESVCFGLFCSRGD